LFLILIADLQPPYNVKAPPKFQEFCIKIGIAARRGSRANTGSATFRYLYENRSMFEETIEAYSQWNEGDPQPTVTYEVHYQPQEIPISRACGLLWNCTDSSVRRRICTTARWAGLMLRPEKTPESDYRVMYDKSKGVNSGSATAGCVLF
jgi:hypothetical protein